MRAMSRRGGALFAAGVIGFAVVTTLVGVASGAPLDFLIADLVTGMAFVVAGYAAIRLRPASPAGPMLMACAVLWWVGSYSPSGQPVVMYIGFAFERYYDLVLGALLLILSSRSQRLEPRWLIIGFAAAFAFRSFGRLFFFDLPTLGCAECPPNPFAVWANVEAWEAVEIVGSYAIAAFAAAVGVVVVVRLLSAGPVIKRARGWILAAGILAMGAATFDAFEYGYTTANHTQGLFELEGVADWLFSWGLFAARVLVPLAILVAILRMRAAPGPLGGFAAGLDQPGGSSAGDALRRALGDPSLQLLRPAADGGWVAEDGTVAALPAPGQARSVTLVGDANHPVAALIHDPALLDQPELVAAVTRVLRLALENERLQSELQDQLRLVTDSRTRIVSATEEERRRLERDLHDGAQQRLVAVMLALQEAREAVGVADDPAVGERLDAAAAELNDAIRELRELARGIHPAILEEEGLGAAVSGLARRAGLPVEVHAALDGRLPPLVESTAYFTIAEALTNAQRHANATQAEIHLAHADGRLDLRVIDDGTGGADPGRGTGLRGLADRVSALGGEFEVTSTSAGGTTVHASIPVT
jgi:signal transduction histidine kinase